MPKQVAKGPQSRGKDRKFLPRDASSGAQGAVFDAAVMARILGVSEESAVEAFDAVKEETGVDGSEMFDPFLCWYAHLMRPETAPKPSVDWAAYAKALTDGLEAKEAAKSPDDRKKAAIDAFFSGAASGNNS